MKVSLRMVKRPYWIGRFEDAWRKHSVIWLSGVRRVGKTTLCLSLDKVEYFDCERPRVRRQMEDPESFLAGSRDKRGHEVDFVLARRGQAPVAIECKWSADRFDPKSPLSFRQAYPKGRNFVVAQDVERIHARRFGAVEVTLTSLDALSEMLQES